jgi:hypothetical protein
MGFIFMHVSFRGGGRKQPPFWIRGLSTNGRKPCSIAAGMGMRERMLRRATMAIWRFATLLMCAVALATSLAHLLELPAKMGYDAKLYVMLHRTLYWNYGRIGGPAEVIAMLLAVGLAWRLRGTGARFSLSALGAALLVAAFTVFLLVVQPANSAMLAWPLDGIPLDWARWRDRWEYGHAARAALMLGGFSALLASFLRRT